MSSKSVQTVNPANGENLESFSYHSASEVEQSVIESQDAFFHWRRQPLSERLKCVESLEKAMRSARLALAEKITLEMGKPIQQSYSEIDKCIASCQTLRERFPVWRKEFAYDLPDGYSVAREPLGVLLGIMPWNYPLWQVIRFAVPALLCGNSILLKHAPNTWGVAEIIGQIFDQAFPHRLYTNLKIDVNEAGRLIADSRVRGVSLTGSRGAGASVGALAGQHLKKCVLELGGSDAYVILDDADLDEAARICATARLVNTGQSCVAAKRFIVTGKNADAFTKNLRRELEVKKIGDPMQAKTELGPLARADLRDLLHEQVKRSVAGGAKAVLGGEPVKGQGYFYPPTLLEGVRPGQAAFDEELFGPVAAVIAAKNESDAFQLANRSRYGLGGAIFSRDVARAKALAVEEMDAGMVFVNDFVKSTAGAPFGGVKDSGLGRELGKEGSFEFTNIKLIYVKSTKV